MNNVIPRLQVFEIDDQEWFPPFLRARVQTVLTGLWTAWLPPLQHTSPATQTAEILLKAFGNSIHDYTVVDFCSGAGGPTPAIEAALNQQLAQASTTTDTSATTATSISTHTRNRWQADTGVETAFSAPAVDFVLTDLAPHPTAWAAMSDSRPHLHYVPESVNATGARSDLLPSIGLQQKAVLRTFHLSFHHFPDDLAVLILRDTFETADAIAVVELIERTVSSLIMELLMLVPIFFLTPFWAWRGGGGGANKDGVDWPLLFFTYIVPVVPIVVIFDGWMSSLRARTPDEIRTLVERARRPSGQEPASEWDWEIGREQHTFLLGYTTYAIGRKKKY